MKKRFPRVKREVVTIDGVEVRQPTASEIKGRINVRERTKKREQEKAKATGGIVTIPRNTTWAGRRFEPSLKEWKEACYMFTRPYQMLAYFAIGKESFREFMIRKQRLSTKEGGEGTASEFIKCFVEGRQHQKRTVERLFQETLHEKKDPALLIFAQKSVNEALTQSEFLAHQNKKEHMRLQRRSADWKRESYIVSLAEKFSLDKKELKSFSKKFAEERELAASRAAKKKIH